MERSLNSEERIRRAEEIYYRRRMQNGVRVPTSNVNTKSKPNYYLLKKMILQILICLFIYFIFYLVKNSNYIFSEDVIQKTKEFLSYDINLQAVYEQVGNYYNEHIKGLLEGGEEKKEENEAENKEEEGSNEENNNTQVEGENNEDNHNEQTEGGIGGGEEGSSLIENEIQQASADEQQSQPLSQMEIDASDIKANYSFILPLKGTVTSRYGPREPTEIVSANHAGIDIGVNEGTVFTAAMEGTVTYVSSEGGYGNHVYIEKDDVLTLYAHCKNIYVKEGDTIAQGQQIGEVGQTGNATRTTFTF